MRNIKNGFSLMEMMVVMLIVAVVAAASAPMVSKKMLTEASKESPWVWTGGDNSIAYNLDASNATAVIGAVNAPVNTNTKLYIEEDNNNQLTLGDGSSRLNINIHNHTLDVSSPSLNSIKIGNDESIETRANSIAIGLPSTNDYPTKSTNGFATAIGMGALAEGGNSVAVGHRVSSQTNAVALGRLTNATGTGSLAVGNGATANGNNAVAVGNTVTAAAPQSVAIGYNAKINQNTYNNAVAIGSSVNAKANNAVALGYNSNANHANSVAINGDTTASNQIMLGNGHAVRVPGSVVTNNVNSTSGNLISATSVGDDDTTPSSVSIGPGASAWAENQILLGPSGGTHDVRVPGRVITNQVNSTTGNLISATSVGDDTTPSSISIGPGANAWAQKQILLGTSEYTVRIPGTVNTAKVVSTNGNLIKSETINGVNRITIGDTNSTVYIPGNLVVGKYAVLGYNGKKLAYLSYPTKGNYDNWHLRGIRVGSGSDDKLYWGNQLGNLNWLPYETNNAATSAPSDRRLKNVGEVFKGGLAEIKKLEVFNYTFKKDDKKTPRVGVMAQDLQKIFPNAVFKGDDGFLRIRMEDMFYALVNAVKELDAKIDTLIENQKRVDELEKRIEKLEKRLSKLEKK